LNLAMISLEQHQSLMDKQRVYYEEMIRSLKEQLSNPQTPEPSQPRNVGGNLNRRQSSIMMDSLIGVDPVEDNLDETPGHTRGVTSQLFAELLEFDDDGDDWDSSSDDPQHKGGYDAIVLEQQLMSERVKDTNDVGELKEIIETLKAELANSRMSEYQMHNTQQRLKSAHIHRERDCEGMKEFERLKVSKMDLVDSLSNEFERLRQIIKRQHTQIALYQKYRSGS